MWLPVRILSKSICGRLERSLRRYASGHGLVDLQAVDGLERGVDRHRRPDNLAVAEHHHLHLRVEEGIDLRAGPHPRTATYG